MIFVVLVVYLKVFIYEFVNLFVNNKINVVILLIIIKRINVLMEISVDIFVVEDLWVYCFFVYFLKCLILVKEGFEFKKMLFDLEKWLLVL